MTFLAKYWKWLVGAVIIGFDKGRVIVQSSTGPLFVVNSAIKGKKLKEGMFVSLNQRTFAIMDILPLTRKDIKKKGFLKIIIKKKLI